MKNAFEELLELSRGDVELVPVIERVRAELGAALKQVHDANGRAQRLVSLVEALHREARDSEDAGDFVGDVIAFLPARLLAAIEGST